MLALMHQHHPTSSVQTHSFSRILHMDSLTNTDSFYKRGFLERRLLWATRVTSFSMRPMGLACWVAWGCTLSALQTMASCPWMPSRRLSGDSLLHATPFPYTEHHQHRIFIICQRSHDLPGSVLKHPLSCLHGK